MALDLMADIAAFHERFELAYDGPPRELPYELAVLRERRLQEEAEEYTEAILLEKRFDALIDTVYVALGNAYLHGFNFEEGWRRVHEANMKKVRAQHASESRHSSALDIIKPPGWVEPHLGDLVGYK